MHTLEKLSLFEQIIKYNFKKKDLLITALTHPSYNLQNEGVIDNYQRLEFLGDAVLSFIITDELYKLYPKAREGELARYRSVLIRGIGLARYARKINLSDFVLLSEAESKTGGSNKDSILEDVFEALIGAIYLDDDIESVRSFIKFVFDDIEEVLESTLPSLNPKGQLQEFIQQKMPNLSIAYILVNASGPDHSKSFIINAVIDGKILGTGTGSSKKIAEEQAAVEALMFLKTNLDLG